MDAILKNTDRRLTEAYQLIDSGSIKILSLDIFDTLLWRKVPTPEDLFLILGQRLKNEGWLIPSISKENFTELRIKAEKEARATKEIFYKTSEVTLPEIYWKLQNIFVSLSLQQMLQGTLKGIYESDNSELITKEVAVEKELLQFDSNILQLVHYTRQTEIPVILTSDTYFESHEIEEFLGVSKALFSKIYLSCEHGCGKRKGLFLKIIQDLSIDPHEILHIGDNYKSDIAPACQRGVRTIYYEKHDDQLKEIFGREWSKELHKRAELLDPLHGDFGITTLRAKMAYHSDLEKLHKEQHFFWKYGATILGPILWGFIHWIYDRSKERREKKLFCLMREGQLYANLIKYSAPYLNHSLEAHPLWISRYFILHAAMESANKIELKKVFTIFFQQLTLQASCSCIGLDIDKIKKWSDYRYVTLEDPQLLEEFVEDVSSDALLTEQIVLSAASKRRRFIKYLSGLTDLTLSLSMTLVDVGWSGTIQEALRKIFHIENISIDLYGLYLGTTKSTYTLLLQGLNLEGYLINCGYPFENIHLKGCFVLEQTACAETGLGSLKDIDENGQIITHSLLIPDKQKKQAKIIQQGIHAFFDRIGPYVKSGQITWNCQSESLQNYLRSILLRSMANTTLIEARKLGPWLHDHAPSSNLTQVIGKDVYYDRFIKDMLPTAIFRESGLNWPSAYTAKHSKYLTIASQAMWLKTLPFQCLLSEDEYKLQVHIDKGRGFAKKPFQEHTLRSNPNRNFYSIMKVFSAKSSIKRLQLTLKFPYSIVRINSLRLIVFKKSEPNPENITLFETENIFKSLECAFAKQLTFNTFYCENELKFIQTFEHSDIHQIRVKLCCEKFTITS